VAPRFRARTHVQSKKNIIIIGAGLSALSTAFNLTTPTGWNERYNVTIYQIGWRLGGKLASSRNLDQGLRIEEHGIHVFSSYYNNCFHTLKACNELTDYEFATGIKDMQQCFIGSNTACDLYYFNKSFSLIPSNLPFNTELPWDGNTWITSANNIIDSGLRSIKSVMEDKAIPWKPEVESQNTYLHIKNNFFHHVSESIEHGENSIKHWLIDHAIHAFSNFKPETKINTLNFIIALMEGLVHVLYPCVIHDNDHGHRVFMAVDFYCTILKGIIKDDLLEKDLDTVDNMTYLQWLKKHGIKEETLQLPLVILPVNICFQYKNGNSEPTMSAAAYLSFIVRALLGKGSGIYKFVAGSGETIIAPLYLALKKRGVQFKFFHKAEEFHLSNDKKSIQSIDFRVQATTIKDKEYSPLLKERVKGFLGWPNRPNYEQLNEANQILELEKKRKQN